MVVNYYSLLDEDFDDDDDDDDDDDCGVGCDEEETTKCEYLNRAAQPWNLWLTVTN